MDDIEATVFVDMGNINNAKILKKWQITVCPYTETQLNFMSSALRSIIKNKKDPPDEVQFMNINVEEILHAYRLKESRGSFLPLGDFHMLDKAAK